MPSPRYRPSRPHRQLDLDLASAPAMSAMPPVWCALPHATQRTLTGLLTRLLIAHADGPGPELARRLGGELDER